MLNMSQIKITHHIIPIKQFSNLKKIIGYVKAVFYTNDIKNIFQYNDKDVSITDNQILSNFSSIDKNTESYKTSSIYEFLEIFFNQERIKIVKLKYFIKQKIGLLIANKKNQHLD